MMRAKRVKRVYKVSFKNTKSDAVVSIYLTEKYFRFKFISTISKADKNILFVKYKKEASMLGTRIIQL